jgi:hypothetical protein
MIGKTIINNYELRMTGKLISHYHILERIGGMVMGIQEKSHLVVSICDVVD